MDRVIMRKKDRGDYIIDGVCKYYDLPREKITKPAPKNPKISSKRYLLVHMLYHIADFKLKDIADVLGYKSSSVYALSSMMERMSEQLDKHYGDKKMIKEYEDILKQLNL